MAGKKKTFGLILILAFLVIAYFGYRALTNGGNPLPDALEQKETATKQGEEILMDLNRLKTIHFDSSLFTSPVFLSLKDFTVDVAGQPKGRPNPFAPLGVNDPAKLEAITSQAIAAGVPPVNVPAQEQKVQATSTEDGAATSTASSSTGDRASAAGSQTSVSATPPSEASKTPSETPKEAPSETASSDTVGPPPPPPAPSM